MIEFAPQQSMALETLMDGFGLDELPSELVVNDLKLDSRDVNPGDLFIAMKGVQQDGTAYIDAAIERGAVAVALDADSFDSAKDYDVPVVCVADIRSHLGEIADRFFLHPSEQLSVIGVTGTNGKTSCCQYIAQGLEDLQISCGVIGTLGWGNVKALQDTGSTTPDVISVHRMLAAFVANGCKVVAMEVSSHGLDQMRVNGVHFDTAVFTNLSRDHLDYHEEMEHYGASKRKLFFMPGLKHAVVNNDDSFGRNLQESLSGQVPVRSYSVTSHEVDISVSKVQFSANGIRACLHSPWGEGILTSSLLGRFNLSNLLAVYSVLCLQGVQVDKALEVISKITTVPGRMQRFGGRGSPSVIVDYAHTPDALKVVLNTLREFCQGRLFCVFGCGGDRDQGKRPLMGEVAEELADHVVLTNDNPRHESPADIIRDIQKGMAEPYKANVCPDRAKAIQAAVTKAGPDDIVLVAGKGHENYQEVGGAHTAFSDAEQVRQALNIWALMRS